MGDSKNTKWPKSEPNSSLSSKFRIEIINCKQPKYNKTNKR